MPDPGIQNWFSVPCTEPGENVVFCVVPSIYRRFDSQAPENRFLTLVWFLLVYNPGPIEGVLYSLLIPWCKFGVTQNPQYSKSAVLKNPHVREIWDFFWRFLQLHNYKHFKGWYWKFRQLSFSGTKNNFHDYHILRVIQK